MCDVSLNTFSLFRNGSLEDEKYIIRTKMYNVNNIRQCVSKIKIKYVIVTIYTRAIFNM